MRYDEQHKRTPTQFVHPAATIGPTGRGYASQPNRDAARTVRLTTENYWAGRNFAGRYSARLAA